MASNPRSLVQAMIRRRVAKHVKMNASKAEKPVEEMLSNFLTNFDDRLSCCKSNVEKYWVIEQEPETLLRLLQAKDKGCSIELRWHGDDISNIRLEGIKLTWSDEYTTENDVEQDVVVDIFSMYFK